MPFYIFLQTKYFKNTIETPKNTIKISKVLLKMAYQATIQSKSKLKKLSSFVLFFNRNTTMRIKNIDSRHKKYTTFELWQRF